MLKQLHDKAFDLDKTKLRDAARLSIQSATAAVALFLIMQAFGLPEKFVGILSAVLIVQPSIGTTLGNAKTRFIATLVGSLLGVLTLLLVPAGYGTAGALAFTMLVLNAVAGFKPEWRYGVVAAVALALGSDQELWTTAADRSLAIGLGVLVGVLASIVVWPDPSTQRTRRHLDDALGHLARLLGDTLRHTARTDTADIGHHKNRFNQHLADARELADTVQLADDQPLWERIDCLERLYQAALLFERLDHDQTQDIEQDALRHQLDEIRDGIIKLANAFHQPPDRIREDFDKLSQTIDQYLDLQAQQDDNAETTTRRHTLAFGLHLFRDNFVCLIELAEQEEENK